MADEYLEREVKYDVPADFVVPSLDGIADGETDEKSVQLNSVYFDTEHRDLLARGITLRCRTGTTDNGWQLKVPAGADRTEIRLDPTGNQRSAPAELADLVKGVRRGKPLRHIVTVRTDRTVRTVRSVDQQVVAEVADDRALAVNPGRRGSTLAEWREVEAELGPAGTDRNLSAIDDRLTKAGAVASTAANKVARALGADPDRGYSKDKKRARTAGDVILRYLVEQDDALLIGDLDLRRGFGAIHPTRVATRRLRSTLRIFSDYVDAARAKAFDAELSWYADLLGNVRDREVQRARFAEAIAELPDVDGAEAAGRQLEEQLLAEQQHHRAILDKASTDVATSHCCRSRHGGSAILPSPSRPGRRPQHSAIQCGPPRRRLPSTSGPGSDPGTKMSCTAPARQRSVRATPPNSRTASSTRSCGSPSRTTRNCRTFSASTRTARSPLTC